jgi:hypothetical protein
MEIGHLAPAGQSGSFSIGTRETVRSLNDLPEAHAKLLDEAVTASSSRVSVTDVRRFQPAADHALQTFLPVVRRRFPRAGWWRLARGMAWSGAPRRVWSVDAGRWRRLIEPMLAERAADGARIDCHLATVAWDCQ